MNDKRKLTAKVKLPTKGTVFVTIAKTELISNIHVYVRHSHFTVV